MSRRLRGTRRDTLPQLSTTLGRKMMQPDKKNPYVAEIYREITHVRPHEEDDWDWMSHGMSLLKRGKLGRAEKKFKELLVAQPEHHDGYEGLALTYQKMNMKDRAFYFMEEALKRARGFLQDGSLDPEVIEEMEEELRQIRGMG